MILDGPGFLLTKTSQLKLEVARKFFGQLPLSTTGQPLVDGLTIPMNVLSEQQDATSCGFIMCLGAIWYGCH
jgi:hypothetical protein